MHFKTWKNTDANYDGYSWLPTWLHLELVKIQLIGYTCEWFFLNHLKWEDPPLIWIFWAGKILFQSGPRLLLETCIRTVEEGRFVLLLLALPLSAHPSLPWHWSLLHQDSSIHRSCIPHSASRTWLNDRHAFHCQFALSPSFCNGFPQCLKDLI